MLIPWRVAKNHRDLDEEKLFLRKLSYAKPTKIMASQPTPPNLPPSEMKVYPAWKLTWQWKIHHLKMYFLLKMGIFRCYVSFQGCNSLPY